MKQALKTLQTIIIEIKQCKHMGPETTHFAIRKIMNDPVEAFKNKLDKYLESLTDLSDCGG